MSKADGGGRWPPDEIEEYRLLRQLGQGGMGVVYLAEDRLLARLVAIKLIDAPSPSEAARSRFFAEARAVARLSHPNVVSVFRVGEVRGRPFLVSEYVRGQSLAELDKPLDPRRALAIAVELARGLAAAHRRGVLHRDIKPANAMIGEDGTVKLLDFGLAELLPGAGAEGGDAARAMIHSGGAEAESMRDSAPGALPGGAGAISTADLVSRPDRAAPPGAVPFASTLDVGPLLCATTPAPTADAAPRPAPRRLAGTPLYMAPELWRFEPATPGADVYALGVLVYELCCGAPPHAELPLAARIQEAAPSLSDAAPGIDPRLAAIVDRCLLRDPSLRYPNGDALRAALEALAAPAVTKDAVLEGNPYRGLLAFEAEHRRMFFGRSAEVLAIVDRLRADPFVLVAGDSGTGKSSLCRAGVLPAVADGALGRPVAVATALLGRDPLTALAAALAPLLDGDETAVAERLRAEPATVARDLVRRHGAALLFVDQLEELSTLASPPDAASAAAALHGLAGRTGRVRLLATARSDFLTRLSALPDLGDDLPAALYLLRPLTGERLREAVIGPAAAKGFSFASDAVVEALVVEALRAPGGLPLLQFALAELWEGRDEARRVIPTARFEAQGGVPSALGRHADGVLARVPPPHRAAFRAILLALVTAEGTRARRGEAELLAAARGSPDEPPGARAALDALVRGRLLVAREGEDSEGSVFELAHEALLSGWDTLRGWLGHDAEGRAQRQRIERAAAEWDRAGRPVDALWGPRLLAEVAAVDERSLAQRDAAFLAASRRSERRRRFGRWAAALVVPLAIGAGILGVRVEAAIDMGRRVDEARRALDRARAARGEADELRRIAFARFDAHDLAQAERGWTEALDSGAKAEKAFAEVCGRLEHVLQQDADREDARALLADALYERARLADRDGHAAERDELARRLAVTGKPGAASPWDRPARLAIETTPPGAGVALERFALHGERWVTVPEASLGPTPVAERPAAPGSVVLVFSAPGRASVRLPLVLERGETCRIALDLPPAAAVPEGFVLVPPGRFLYGSASAEARAFFGTQPIHPVETGAYLIAENETTFAEWIAFLRALPPAERSQRMPKAGGAGFVAALAELPGGEYELTFGQETHLATARIGEPLRYLGRDRRTTQDWMRFPVSGILLDDVLAYAAWLDRTRRVPGARLCTEHEWERAARGADGRSYPGGERLFADDANIDVTYGRNRLGFGPDEVGSHRASDSPFGLRDMAGNVWEFTLSVADPREPVARGGSSFQIAVDARGENRAPQSRDQRDPFIGARICATPGTP
ncbi:bifunctional serine/threonine-protein kinase/formylglycine-generating enzyme family protein [Sorangium sp. So ce295]|uniref:nSTAND1 domain-containing NTPase n=1 Tax=Sorangium sp. So ce295 TaxID=3133295 RepID=UPI003F623CFA